MASKYFVVERQDNWAKTLEEYKTSSSLSEFITELEDTRKIWKKSDKSSENIVSFISLRDIDGTLVGGASLEANKFIELIKKLDL